jgi:hypothetical protein
MQQIGTNETATCSGNDLALVAIHPADRPDVHPAVQGFGGPTGLASPSDVGLGDRVEWYGNTALTPSSEATNRHEGSVVTSTEWDFQAYSATPGMPGDSGSGIMLADGQAAGILYAVNTFYPGANSITHLQPALSFAEENADVDVELVTGPHTGSLP